VPANALCGGMGKQAGVCVRFTPSVARAVGVVTGDGMLRRLPRTLSTWTAGEGCRLHITQGEILARAVALLPPGGRVVYSTCSLNPVEDEAVVAHVAPRTHHVSRP